MNVAIAGCAGTLCHAETAAARSPPAPMMFPPPGSFATALEHRSSKSS